QPTSPAFREYSSQASEKPKTVGFRRVPSLQFWDCLTFATEISDSLQPQPGKLPASGIAPWRQKNKTTARQGKQ
ncbi:MAG: hypothetical protein V4661_00595, partial [Pseudomonadota bacterium]